MPGSGSGRMSTSHGGSDSSFNAMVRPLARRRGDGAQASQRIWRLPPERCSPHRAELHPRSRPRWWDLRFSRRRGLTSSPPSFASGLRIGRRLASGNRYRAAQIASVEEKWAAVEEEGETWFGFSAVRPMPGTRDEVLPGAASRSYARGIAASRSGRRDNDWLLHCGDAYFHHSEVEPDGGAAPKGLRWFESLMDFDGAQRRANQVRLRELARLALGEVKLICSHDIADFAAMKSEAREARPAPAPVRRPRLDGALRGAARLAQQSDARASRR